MDGLNGLIAETIHKSCKDFDSDPHCLACTSERVSMKFHDSSGLSWIKVTCLRCSYSYNMKTRIDDPPKEAGKPDK